MRTTLGWKRNGLQRPASTSTIGKSAQLETLVSVYSLQTCLFGLFKKIIEL